MCGALSDIANVTENLTQTQPNMTNEDTTLRNDTLTATELRPEWRHVFNNKQDANCVKTERQEAALTTENLKENVCTPCLMGKKGKGVTRIAVTNPNSINPSEIGGSFN